MRNMLAMSVLLMAGVNVAHADVQYSDRARVLSVTPQVERVNQPRQECRTEYVRESMYEPRSNSGSIIGGVAGGLIGSTIGRGAGRIAAAAVGAGLGAIVGDRVDNNGYGYRGDRVVTRPVEQCVMLDNWQPVTTGFLVNYEYQGRQYTMLMDRDPGPFVDVDVAVRPRYSQGQPVNPAYNPVAYQDRPYPRGHRRDNW